MTKLILEDETYQLRGALFQVYRELKGSGISEAAWKNALAIVLDENKIPHKEQTTFSVHYKGIESVVIPLRRHPFQNRLLFQPRHLLKRHS